MKIRKFDNFDHLNEGTQGGGNKFILVRFGNNAVPPLSQWLMAEVITNKNQSLVMKGPGSIISMFETGLTKEALIQGLDGFSIKYNLYQIVHTSEGGNGPQLVARQRTPAQVKKELDKAVTDEKWEKAAELRDELDRLEGRPVGRHNAAGNNESHLYKFEHFLIEKEEEEFVNGTNSQEFYKLVSELVDHEIKECEGGEEGEMGETCKKIKDYLVQNSLWVAPEEKEGDKKKEGEE
jgi:hypothetical protein